MSSMNQNMPPSLCSMSCKVALETYSTLLCQLLFMGPKLSAALKKKYILDNSKQAYRPVHKNGRFEDKNKVRISVTKEGFDSNRLHLHARKEIKKELYKMNLAANNAESGDVVTSFDLKPFQKPDGQEEYETEQFQLETILEKLLYRFFDFSFLKLPILMAFFQQMPVCMSRSLLEQFCQQLQDETLKYAKGLLIKGLLSISSKSNNLAAIDFQSKAKTLDLDENSEKPVEKSISSTSTKAEPEVSVKLHEKTSAKHVKTCCESSESIWMKTKTLDLDENSEKPAEKSIYSTSTKAEPEVSVKLHEKTSAKHVKTCSECHESIWMKKFFDERRFGILEKCKCVVCYGCLRKVTGATDRVVKGPVCCPRCFSISDNVASSSNWIKDEDKADFFKEYCKNVQNTGIKMRLGWTSFPTRKDNLWTRAL